MSKSNRKLPTGLSIDRSYCNTCAQLTGNVTAKLGYKKLQLKYLAKTRLDCWLQSATHQIQHTTAHIQIKKTKETSSGYPAHYSEKFKNTSKKNSKNIIYKPCILVISKWTIFVLQLLIWNCNSTWQLNEYVSKTRDLMGISFFRYYGGLYMYITNG